MRMSQPFALTAAAAVAAGVLAGCSGTGSSSISPLVPTSDGLRQAISLRGSGIAPQYLESIHLGAAAPQARPNSGGKLLAVTDFGRGATGGTEVLNGSYGLVQKIRNGMDGPDGDWYDQAGNLYVANYSGMNVQEYAPGASSPSFTYSTGLTDPINVTTDESGNVYVVDGMGGFVSEFPQGSNTPTFTCAVRGNPEGVAVTERGKVFVDLNQVGPGVVEFPAGLGSCRNVITLGVLLIDVGGMQLDIHHNLVICDQLGLTVDIVAPPYTIVTRFISDGFGDPFHVALNKNNTLMFVADPGNFNVKVLKYPSGIPVTTLGQANGLSIPAGVATNPFQH
jgi:hypothetical protein